MGQVMITETSNMMLKYIKWKRPLYEHPDFIKARQDAYRMGIDKAFKKHDCLHFLGMCNGADDERNKENFGWFTEQWGDLMNKIEGKIDILSHPFTEGFLASNDEFSKNGLLEEMHWQRLTGCFFIPIKDNLGIDYNYYLYDFTYDVLGRSNGVLIHLGTTFNILTLGIFSDEGMEFSFVDDDYASFIKKGITSTEISQSEWGDLKRIMCVQNDMNVIACYHLFKRYAKIEVKDAKMLDKKDPDHPIVKTTIRDVNYIDCSWFTTIVRSEGFKVRGHFRLQPYKNEQHEWDKKLIYISPFEKHGYTRRAKKLLELPQTEESL